MSSTSSSPRFSNRRAGMISIMTTMILLIIISLIVFGFAQMTRRNQRQTLWRQRPLLQRRTRSLLSKNRQRQNQSTRRRNRICRK